MTARSLRFFVKTNRLKTNFLKTDIEMITLTLLYHSSKLWKNSKLPSSVLTSVPINKIRQFKNPLISKSKSTVSQECSPINKQLRTRPELWVVCPPKARANVLPWKTLENPAWKIGGKADFSQVTNLGETAAARDFDSLWLSGNSPRVKESSVRLFHKSKRHCRKRRKKAEHKMPFEITSGPPVVITNARNLAGPSQAHLCASMMQMMCEHQSFQFRTMVECHTRIMDKLIDRAWMN